MLSFLFLIPRSLTLYFTYCLFNTRNHYQSCAISSSFGLSGYSEKTKRKKTLYLRYHYLTPTITKEKTLLLILFWRLTKADTLLLTPELTTKITTWTTTILIKRILTLIAITARKKNHATKPLRPRPSAKTTIALILKSRRSGETRRLNKSIHSLLLLFFVGFLPNQMSHTITFLYQMSRSFNSRDFNFT